MVQRKLFFGLKSNARLHFGCLIRRKIEARTARDIDNQWTAGNIRPSYFGRESNGQMRFTTCFIYKTK